MPFFSSEDAEEVENMQWWAITIITHIENLKREEQLRALYCQLCHADQGFPIKDCPHNVDVGLDV